MVEPALLADQVIFTSIPSFMGEGYRIVAASPSVRPNERMEITQRCPSHNGLSNLSSDATGFLSFRLSTDRFCIGYCCYAGAEHTARGGQRVYTRLAILDRETFRNFDFNPLPIHAILARVVGPTPSLKTLDRLDPLPLTSTTDSSAISQFSCTPETIATFVKLVLESHQIIAASYLDPQNILSWTLALVPFSIRENLCASIGLNYAPARKFQLTFLDRDDGQTKRLIRGRNIDWLEPSQPIPDQPSPFVSWITFIHKSLQTGKKAYLRKLSSLLDLAQLPQDLIRIGDLCHQLDLLDSGDETLIQELQSRYATTKPSNPAEAFLLDELRNSFVKTAH
jgi:hypothetical protein